MVCLTKADAEVSLYCLTKADTEVSSYCFSKLDSDCYSYSLTLASNSSWIKSSSNATVTETCKPWFLDLYIIFIWESTILSLYLIKLHLINYLKIISSFSFSIILIDLFLIKGVLKHWLENISDIFSLLKMLEIDHFLPFLLILFVYFILYILRKKI